MGGEREEPGSIPGREEHEAEAVGRSGGIGPGISLAAPAGTIAAGPKRQFERLDVTKFDKSLVQQVINGRDVEVIVELDQASVAPRRLSRAQQVATARQLKANQDKLGAGIRKLGGKIERQYQYTLNGIQLRVPSRRLGRSPKLPGVKAVHAVTQHYMDNAKSVPFIGAPLAWQDYGATGNGQTIAVIDGGIDYTHANFGGPGTVEAYEANDSSIIEDGTFPTAKVIDGWDFAGDDYDAARTTGPRSAARPIRSTAPAWATARTSPARQPASV